MPYTKKLMKGIIGIYLSALTSSYFLQKLFVSKYESISFNQNHQLKYHTFKYPLLITWLTSLFCTVYGLLYGLYKKQKINPIPIKQKSLLGFLYTLNYLLTNYSLLFVSFPVQAMAKNLRYVFVVLISIFFTRAQKVKGLKLPTNKVIITLFITLGTTVFLYYESYKGHIKIYTNDFAHLIGYTLLIISVIGDGFLVDNQSYCKGKYHPTTNHLFTACHFYAFCILLMIAIVTADIKHSITFCYKHPTVIPDIISVCFFQTLGQISIYQVIANFKQHIYPLISTTRKIFTLFISYIVFDHAINFYQKIGILLTFSAMGYELYDQIITQQANRIQKKSQRIKQYPNSLSEKSNSSQTDSISSQYSEQNMTKQKQQRRLETSTNKLKL